MPEYTVKYPVKLADGIHKSGTVELDVDAAMVLVKSGSLVAPTVVDGQLAGVVMPDGEQKDLDALHMDDLTAIARDLEIEGYSSLPKAELIAAIKSVQAQVSA